MGGHAAPLDWRGRTLENEYVTDSSQIRHESVTENLTPSSGTFYLKLNTPPSLQNGQTAKSTSGDVPTDLPT